MNNLYGFLLCVLLWVLWSKFGRHLKLLKWLGYDPLAVPWAAVRSFKALGTEHGHNDLMFVSRHDIAECGLTCPNCNTVAAERGDFSGVRRALVNGTENEVIKCPGRVIIEMDTEVPCPSWLAASPTTEHGDHLDADGKVSEDGSLDTPDFFRFKRITPEQALREKYGFDMGPTPEGMQIQDATVVPVEYQRGKKDDVLTGEALLKAIQAEMLKNDAEKVASKPLDPEATPIVGTPVPKDSSHV